LTDSASPRRRVSSRSTDPIQFRDDTMPMHPAPFFAILLAAASLSGPLHAAEPPAEYLPGGPIVFDGKVKVGLVALAEDPATVPVTVDASALEDVQRIVVFADYSPIPHVLTYYPIAASPTLSFHFKVEQSTALRAAAQTKDGVWHVGAAEVSAAGGGCTMPAKQHGEKDWHSRLNEVRARIWRRGGDDARLRLRIQHPMDTGLAPGIPAFHIETVEIATPDGALLGRIELHEPVSENPTLTLEPRAPSGLDALRVTGRDNNGNSFDALVPAPVQSSAAPQAKGG
jgi:sulfur-oxidizing protein SoxY